MSVQSQEEGARGTRIPLNNSCGKNFVAFWTLEEAHACYKRLAVCGLSASRMHGHSACFGSCSKSTDLLSADQAIKNPTLQRRGESHTEKDFWTSSSNEMDSVTKNSRSSLRSLSSSKQNQSADTSETNLSANSIDVNHGLTLWIEQRRDWTGKPSQSRSPQLREPVISWSATYEDLLSTSRPFPKPVPLPEMVSFLVGVWEQEGLYD